MWCGGGQGFERVDSWRCGARQGLRERQEAEAVKAAVWGDSGGCSGVFRDSTIATRGQAAGRALRVFAALCLLAVVCGISRAGARTVTRNFEPLARKMTDAKRSHLMHRVSQVFILTNSE